MTTTTYLSFILVSAVIIIVPGPNVMVIVSTALRHGTARGLQVVAGTTVAMALQMLVAVLGTSWFVAEVADGLVVLKWIGAVYLLAIGLWYIRAAVLGAQESAPGAMETFARGFIVSLSNPKTIVFFSAFLPQFVSPQSEFAPQAVVLSATFLLMALCFDSGYALVCARLKSALENPRFRAFQNGTSGALLLVSGAWLLLRR